MTQNSWSNNHSKYKWGQCKVNIRQSIVEIHRRLLWLICTQQLQPPFQCQYLQHYRHTHTHPFNGSLSRTTRVGRYQKKHSPTHTHPDHQTSFINFLHLLRSTASSLFNLCAWRSFLTTSVQVLFGLQQTHQHAFLHPIITFFLQRMPIPSQPVLLKYRDYIIYS